MYIYIYVYIYTYIHTASPHRPTPYTQILWSYLTINQATAALHFEIFDNLQCPNFAMSASVIFH